MDKLWKLIEMEAWYRSRVFSGAYHAPPDCTSTRVGVALGFGRTYGGGPGIEALLGYAADSEDWDLLEFSGGFVLQLST